jgi:hypothetical protein
MKNIALTGFVECFVVEAAVGFFIAYNVQQYFLALNHSDGINSGIFNFIGANTAIKNAKPKPGKTYKVSDEKGMYFFVHCNG